MVKYETETHKERTIDGHGGIIISFNDNNF